MSDEGQTEQEIMKLLRTEAGSSPLQKRTRNCPNEHLIAAYADGGLADRERSHLEAHLADCAVCLEDVAVSVRLVDGSDQNEATPDRLETHLETLVDKTPAWQGWLNWKTTGAVAASFVVVLALLMRPDSEPVQIRPSADLEQIQRSAGTSQLRPSITFPSDGAELTGKGLEIRWIGPKAAMYEVELVADGGALIWAETVGKNRVTLPDSIVLQAGRKYYISVIARGMGGRSIRSKFVGFRVSDH
jgi:hypothetical protein